MVTRFTVPCIGREYQNLYQLKKWGEQKHSDEKWLAILAEEVGEVAKAILENDDVELLKEMCQVGAVLESWVTSRDFFQNRDAIDD